MTEVDLLDVLPEAATIVARLDRTADHYETFARVWADYLETRPHRFDTITDEHCRGTLQLERVSPVPVELSLILGELLYELRAALDNCLYLAAVVISGQDPPPGGDYLEWPICLTRADWRNKIRRLSDLHPDLLAPLETIQPFKVEYPGWNCLRILHDLARVDRHRTVHLVALHVSEVSLRYNKTTVANVQTNRGVVFEGEPLVTLPTADPAPSGPTTSMGSSSSRSTWTTWPRAPGQAPTDRSDRTAVWLSA
jgi:hypothetical protein